MSGRKPWEELNKKEKLIRAVLMICAVLWGIVLAKLSADFLR